VFLFKVHGQSEPKPACKLAENPALLLQTPRPKLPRVNTGSHSRTPLANLTIDDYTAGWMRKRYGVRD